MFLGVRVNFHSTAAPDAPTASFKNRFKSAFWEEAAAMGRY